MSKREYTLEDRQRIIKVLRILHGMTQKEVANKAGIAPTQYQRIESMERSIKNASFDIVCRILSAIEDPMLISLFYYGKYDFLLKYDITKKDPNNKRLIKLFNNHMKKICHIKNE